jgi:S-adenosylmethionine decarboxylase
LNALGRHVILDLNGCEAALLDDLPFIQQSLIEAARATGATIVGQTFHKFSPQGVTGVLAIAESHLCIHTWPEHGYAAVDIFTCGDGFDPHEAARVLIARHGARSPRVNELQRGLLAELNGGRQREAREVYVTR